MRFVKWLYDELEPIPQFIIGMMMILMAAISMVLIIYGVSTGLRSEGKECTEIQAQHKNAGING